MIIKLTILFYRFISITLVMTPMLLNVMFPSTVVASLLFVPLLMLSLSLLFVYLDKQLNEMLTVFTKKFGQHKLNASFLVKQKKVISSQVKIFYNSGA